MSSADRSDPARRLRGLTAADPPARVGAFPPSYGGAPTSWPASPPAGPEREPPTDLPHGEGLGGSAAVVAARAAPDGRAVRAAQSAPGDARRRFSVADGAVGDDPAPSPGWVPSAVRAAADEYGRTHPDPLDDVDDEPAPGGVRRAREGRAVRWSVSWRVAGTAATAVALVVGAVVLRSVALTPGAAVDLPEPAPLGTATADAGGTATTAPTLVAPVVVVDVVGAVAAPGVVRLPGGSRVADAVAAAGGATADADVARLNLARVLGDGEQIVVPRPGDPVPTSTREAGAVGGGLVDLNTASPAELDELPGVGPVLAQRIVDRRPFTSVDELDEVSGVGPTLLERLRALVRV